MMWIFAFGLIHVVFLIAIGRRLTHLNYPGSKILSVIFTSFAIWAIAFFVGATCNIELLTIYAGLPIAIVTALLRYGWIEVWVHVLESPAERARRFECVQQEENAHVAQRQSDDRMIERLVPVKSYVGDDQTILAISDLGKLRDRGIPCRIEGSLVKTLYIDEPRIGEAARVITLDVGEIGETQPESASPP